MEFEGFFLHEDVRGFRLALRIEHSNKYNMPSKDKLTPKMQSLRYRAIGFVPSQFAFVTRELRITGYLQLAPSKSRALNV